LSAIALAAAIALPTCVALAQQAPSGGPRPVAPKASKDVKETAPASDAGLLKRVEQLEEQLVDMQVLVGTLESLAKGGPRPPSTSVYKDSGAVLSAADAGRLDALETQVRALAAQLESLQDQLRSLADRPPGPGTGGFGAVTVAPGEPKDGDSKETTDPKDDLDRVFPPSKAKPGKIAKAGPLPGESLADEDTPPQQLYERAYGYLLQKDYSTAEATFETFLKRHPSHQLAGNAQYWLGETFYVRGQYRPAAAAFLKGYQDYSKSQKAPESLLKLAMSLQRLGQKDAACSSFAEFATKYPSPPAHIKALAQTERQRSGCPG
jgi:tol-pal system protein YbgF